MWCLLVLGTLCLAETVFEHDHEARIKDHNFQEFDDSLAFDGEAADDHRGIPVIEDDVPEVRFVQELKINFFF